MLAYDNCQIMPPNMTSMKRNAPPIIRFAHPLAFGAYLQHLGAPVDGYFRRQGLPALCKDPNVFVPLKKAWALFDDAGRREDCALGWHVGRYVGDQGLNAGLLKKLESAPTLYRALQRLIGLVNSESSHLRLGIVEQRNCILFYTSGYQDMRDEAGFSSSQAYQIAVYVDLIQHFTGKRWIPKSIGIQTSEIPAVAKRHFPNCRILVNQPFAYIAISRSCLHLPLRRLHPDRSGDGHIVKTNGLNYADTLRLVLQPYLSQGYPSTKFAASLMDTSVRSLARRLSECGKPYQSLIDETRFNVATELLRDTTATVGEIGLSIGFADQANFSRLFHRIAGISPRAYRMTMHRQMGQA
jgi:AraC-like DNA-binding protein